jgi:FkbM family methyltransferase
MAKRDVTLGGILNTLARIGWTPAAIIDIGVAHGTEGLYTVWPGVPICLVEPSPVSAEFMRKIAEMFPKVHIYNVGASNRSGSMTVRTDPTGVYTNFSDNKPKWREIEVSVMTCDEIIADSGLKGPFVFKLDTDAHELEIIEGATETLKSTDLCIVELNFFYPLMGQPGPSDLVRAMHDGAS